MTASKAGIGERISKSVAIRGRLAFRLVLLAAAAVLSAALFGSSVSAASAAGFGVLPGAAGFDVTTTNADGSPDLQAGSHPFDFTTNINFKTVENSNGLIVPAEDPRNVVVDLPPGLLGNPTAVPQCTLEQFTHESTATDFATPYNSTECPASSAVGVARLEATAENLPLGVSLYNLTPPTGLPALFGFSFGGVPVTIVPKVRTSDYGITAGSFNTSQSIRVLGVKLEFWGVPADPRHDSERGTECIQGNKTGRTCPAGVSQTPLFTMPTSCSGPLTSTLNVTSWQSLGAPPFAQSIQSHDVAGNPISLTGCNRLPFTPELSAEPTTDAATTPTGLSVNLDVNDPGLTSPTVLAQSQLKKAVVTLPQGFTTNPSVAEGLHSCSLAAYESETLGSDPGTGCPENSKVGDVEIESPLVEQKIDGSVFVAAQNDNPFPNPSLLALYIVAKNPEIGVIVKAAGKVDPDPKTGQLTTTFDNLPQLPFSHFRLSFRQGQRSPLISPPTCGTYTVNAELYPWSNPDVPRHEESSFLITHGPEGNPCPQGTPPFHPQILAGAVNPQAGAYSPFSVKLSRTDSEQEITHFSIKLPPGVSGKLAGVPECSDAAIAAAKAREREGGGAEEEASPSCPPASLVGHSNVGAGVGNVLAYAPGKMYLAGPYHGSNLSLVSITAAKVGPFDLGTVVVRFALKIDPETAEVSVDGATSDPIPHIVDGIPVHLREIRAYVDRPEFTINPTSCDPTSVASTVLGSGLDFASSADDVPVTVSNRFQVANCAALGFKPQLALSLKGGTHRGDTPAFKAVLTARKGDANIGAAQVTLPHSEFLEQSHIKTVCTRVQFKEGAVPGEKCPAASVYGRARAVTPILDEPLEGPVYLRSSSHTLPDLVAALNNKQVSIDLDGRIDSVKGRIRNTFEAVPDAPVTKFTLEMQGGKKGLLTNSTDLCKSTNRAIAAFTGQNGKTHDFNPVLQAQCGAKGKKSKAHKSGKAHR